MGGGSTPSHAAARGPTAASRARVLALCTNARACAEYEYEHEYEYEYERSCSAVPRYCGSMMKSSCATGVPGGVAPSWVSAVSSSATCAADSCSTCSAG